MRVMRSVVNLNTYHICILYKLTLKVLPLHNAERKPFIRGLSNFPELGTNNNLIKHFSNLIFSENDALKIYVYNYLEDIIN